MNTFVINHVAKAIRLRDSTDEFALARAALEALLELPDGEVIYQDCLNISIKQILGEI